MNFRVSLCREYWGYIDIEADNEDDAISKVENYEYEDDEEMVEEKIGEQSVYSAMQVTKCAICGKNIPMDMTQVMINLGNDKYASFCCSHEGSTELTKYMKENKYEINM